MLKIFGKIDFNKNDSINKNISANLGMILQLVNFLEIRADAYRNPLEVLEGFLDFSFLIENSFRLMIATRFNEVEQRTSYSAMIVFPLQTVRF